MPLPTMRMRVLSGGNRFHTMAAIVNDKPVTYWAEGPGLKMIREYGCIVEEAHESGTPTKSDPGYKQYQAICRAAAGGFDECDIEELITILV